MKRIIMLALTLCALGIFVAGCGGSKAHVAAHNLSVEAEQFKIARQIVFFNGITDKYLAVVKGYCSVETTSSALGGSLEVTCQTGHDNAGNPLYKKDYFGLSDNVSYMVEQIDPINVSVNHYTVIFRPQTILPDIDRNP